MISHTRTFHHTFRVYIRRCQRLFVKDKDFLLFAYSCWFGSRGLFSSSLNSSFYRHIGFSYAAATWTPLLLLHSRARRALRWTLSTPFTVVLPAFTSPHLFTRLIFCLHTILRCYKFSPRIHAFPTYLVPHRLQISRMVHTAVPSPPLDRAAFSSVRYHRFWPRSVHILFGLRTDFTPPDYTMDLSFVLRCSFTPLRPGTLVYPVPALPLRSRLDCTSSQTHGHASFPIFGLGHARLVSPSAYFATASGSFLKTLSLLTTIHCWFRCLGSFLHRPGHLHHLDSYHFSFVSIFLSFEILLELMFLPRHRFLAHGLLDWTLWVPARTCFTPASLNYSAVLRPHHFSGYLHQFLHHHPLPSVTTMGLLPLPVLPPPVPAGHFLCQTFYLVLVAAPATTTLAATTKTAPHHLHAATADHHFYWTTYHGTGLHHHYCASHQFYCTPPLHSTHLPPACWTTLVRLDIFTWTRPRHLPLHDHWTFTVRSFLFAISTSTRTRSGRADYHAVRSPFCRSTRSFADGTTFSSGSAGTHARLRPHHVLRISWTGLRCFAFASTCAVPLDWFVVVLRSFLFWFATCLVPGLTPADSAFAFAELPFTRHTRFTPPGTFAGHPFQFVTAVLDFLPSAFSAFTAHHL